MTPNFQPSSMPASAAEISEALKILFSAGLPYQRGAKVDGVALAYVEALRGMTLDAIQAGIRKFIRGECEDVSLRFMPTPPELARIVRTTVVPTRIPAERRIEPARHHDEDGPKRMRLKMPMWCYAFANGGMDELNRALPSLSATIALAVKWGVEVPADILDSVDRNGEAAWQAAHRRAQAAAGIQWPIGEDAA